MFALKCYVLFASFVCCCEPVITVTVEDDEVKVVCVIKFELEFVLHKIVYTESTLLNFSNNGIKSRSSESVVSSNHDLTGTLKEKYYVK